MLKVRKIGFFAALIYVRFLNFLFFDFLNLDKFLNISSTLPSTLINLLLLILNIFRAKSDVFNIKVNSIAILLKP